MNKFTKSLIVVILLSGFMWLGFTQTTITPNIPPFPGDPTKYLNGTGAYTVPAGGGGGGDTLWYSYTGTDAEGGTYYVTASTNSFLPNVAVFGANYLSNFWGDYSAFVSIGYPQADPALMQGNSSLFSIGDYSLYGATMTNCADAFFIGQATGRLMNSANSYGLIFLGVQTANGSTISNSLAVYGIGASFNSSVILDSTAIFAFGNGAAQQASIYSSQENYFFGVDAAKQSSVTNSQNIYAYGDQALASATIADSSDIYAFGGLGSSTITNSTHVISLGQTAGNSISGSYTNVVFIGDGSTIGPTGQDRVILGPAMSISTGDPSSVTTGPEWKLGGEIVPGGTTNIVISINGQKYQIIATPIP